MTMYRLAFEWPHTGRKGRITFLAPTPFAAVRYAGDWVRKCTRGYLLGVEELRPAQLQQELELTT